MQGDPRTGDRRPGLDGLGPEPRRAQRPSDHPGQPGGLGGPIPDASRVERGPDKEDEHHIDHPDQQDHQPQADGERGQHPVGPQDLEAAPGPGRTAVRPGPRRPPPGADQRRRPGDHNEGGCVKGQGQAAAERAGEQTAHRRGANHDEGVQ
jgi:hypothetical protein